MSHYTVGIICESPFDVDNLLMPYYEEYEVEPYINRTKAEMIIDGKERQKRLVEEGKIRLDLIGKLKLEILDGWRIMKAKLRKEPYFDDWYKEYWRAKTDEDFWKIEKDTTCFTYDESGNELTTYNPDSKWDWYSIGGRWHNMLKLKEPGDDGEQYCNCAKIKDIDFTRDEELYEESYNWWKTHVEAPDDEWDGFLKKEYFTDRYNDAEDYAIRNSEFSTFAVITPDGEWHEMGQMGWFGCSSETPEEAKKWDKEYMSFIEEADPEHYFIVVDCHI